MSETVFDRIAEIGVVPVIAIESVEHAIPLADALLEGGLPIAEVTFRTAAAADVIEKMASERPELLVGAGTVLTLDNLQAAVDCGAKFGVAPGMNPEIVSQADDSEWPFVPGIATPSDIECGLSLGCRVLKFFPAGALGGLSMLKALAGPYKHTGVRFMPTGGVSTDNLESYLNLDVIAAAGGTWIAKQADFDAGAWSTITERCKAACEIVAQARS
jgi:2-dehydro-3-deoxyphosphogluconate aldolase / (4S)-4-hydroxy-2-oxoglutarate aldolase